MVRRILNANVKIQRPTADSDTRRLSHESPIDPKLSAANDIETTNTQPRTDQSRNDQSGLRKESGRRRNHAGKRGASEGWKSPPTPQEADVLVVNTCAFIDSAKEESIEAILEAHQESELKSGPTKS